MSPIRILPPLIARQIAAGECIERPASVVKELVENCLDAGATKIKVDIEEAGSQLIRVTDNGGGIPKDELTLALASHATSKILTFDDLLRLDTFGFRGEALASIAAVAEVSLASATSGSDCGHVLESKGDELSPVRPVGMSQGTIIEVRNLFFNVPARRKFLKSKAAEMGQIIDLVTRLALSSFAVGFELNHNNRPVFTVSPAVSRRERIGEILAKEELSWFHAEEQQDAYRLDAYLATSHHHKSDTKWQFYYLNRRYVRDKIATRALEDAYRDYLPDKRHPVAIIYLDIDPALVDVNVHPTKSEVRYRDSQQVYRLIHSAVLTTLRREDLTPPMALAVQPDRVESPLAADRPESEATRSETVTTVSPQLSVKPIDCNPNYSSAYSRETTPRWPVTAADPIGTKALFHERALQPNLFATTENQPAAPGDDTLGCQDRYLQIHQSYIVAEHVDGLVIIDQHALHERILFERIKKQIEKGVVASQPLLFPEKVKLSAGEMVTLTEWQPELRKIGLDVEAIDLDEFAITKIPQLFGKLLSPDLLPELLEQLAQTQTTQLAETLDHLLATMACKAAVKAGDALSNEEIASLLRHKELADNPFHCPHGRPAIVKITMNELAKFFKRT